MRKRFLPVLLVGAILLTGCAQKSSDIESSAEAQATVSTQASTTTSAESVTKATSESSTEQNTTEGASENATNEKSTEVTSQATTAAPTQVQTTAPTQAPTPAPTVAPMPAPTTAPTLHWPGPQVKEYIETTLSGTESNLEKLQKVVDYVYNCDYDGTATKSCAFFLITEHKGDCWSGAELVKYACDYLGLPSALTYIGAVQKYQKFGYIIYGSLHKSVVVCVDGEYCVIEATPKAACQILHYQTKQYYIDNNTKPYSSEELNDDFFSSPYNSLGEYLYHRMADSAYSGNLYANFLAQYTY